MLVVRATYFAFGSPPGLFDADELAHDIHGGEVETSLLLHLAPELVRTRGARRLPRLAARARGAQPRARRREAGRDRLAQPRT